MFELTRPPIRVPAAACPHAQRRAVISEAGAGPRVPISPVTTAAAPAPAGAGSRVCRPTDRSPRGDNAAELPNKETARSLLLAKHLGLGAVLTLPVPSSSREVVEAKIASVTPSWAAADSPGPLQNRCSKPRQGWSSGSP